MTTFINLETKELKTESEIRAAHPNTSFPIPFRAEGYAVVFDNPMPVHDKYSEFCQLLPPKLNINGDYEREWAILPLFGEALANAQIQQVTDEKNKIKADIAAIEASVTPRRAREAILGIDKTWLADIELQIAQLRAKL